MDRIEPTIGNIDIDSPVAKATKVMRLTFSAKMVAWFALLYGTIALLSPFIELFAGREIPTFALVWLLSFGATAIGAGYLSLRGRHWALWLLLAVFLPQTVEYFSSSSAFTLIGPLPAIRIGWGWYSPPARVNINLLALAASVLALRAATRANYSVKWTAAASPR